MSRAADYPRAAHSTRRKEELRRRISPPRETARRKRGYDTGGDGDGGDDDKDRWRKRAANVEAKAEDADAKNEGGARECPFGCAEKIRSALKRANAADARAEANLALRIGLSKRQEQQEQTDKETRARIAHLESALAAAEQKCKTLEKTPRIAATASEAAAAAAAAASSDGGADAQIVSLQERLKIAELRLQSQRLESNAGVVQVMREELERASKRVASLVADVNRMKGAETLLEARACAAEQRVAKMLASGNKSVLAEALNASETSLRALRLQMEEERGEFKQKMSEWEEMKRVLADERSEQARREKDASARIRELEASQTTWASEVEETLKAAEAREKMSAARVQTLEMEARKRDEDLRHTLAPPHRAEECAKDKFKERAKQDEGEARAEKTVAALKSEVSRLKSTEARLRARIAFVLSTESIEAAREALAVHAKPGTPSQSTAAPPPPSGYRSPQVPHQTRITVAAVPGTGADVPESGVKPTSLVVTPTASAAPSFYAPPPPSSLAPQQQQQQQQQQQLQHHQQPQRHHLYPPQHPHHHHNSPQQPHAQSHYSWQNMYQPAPAPVPAPQQHVHPPMQHQAQRYYSYPVSPAYLVPPPPLPSVSPALGPSPSYAAYSTAAATAHPPSSLLYGPRA